MTSGHQLRYALTLHATNGVVLFKVPVVQARPCLLFGMLGFLVSTMILDD